MISLYLMVLSLLLLVHQSIEHILLPPFLPTGCVNQYYQQKFKISQLDTAQFKMAGLPKDIFWTSNGTIFGSPSVSGEWKVNISYDSITQSGSYETVFKIRNATNASTQLQSSLISSVQLLELVFPQNLIFLKNKEQIIQFKVKYSSLSKQQSTVQWKFITLPKGVTDNGDGKLTINIGNQGMYVLRVQVNDLLGNFVQACVTLNVQTSGSQLIETFSIPDPNSAISRLIEVKQKQTNVTKQLFSAVNNLGEQNDTIKYYQDAFNKIANNLVELQSQAKTLQNTITDTLKNKLLKQQKLKQATDIVQSAEDNLNLALIEQQSTNDLLLSAQKDKLTAQQNYNKASKDLDNQLRLVKIIEANLTNKQQEKSDTEKTMAQKKARYSDLAAQLIGKDKELTGINQEIIISQKNLLASKQQLTTQQALLNSEQSAFSSIQQHIAEMQSIVKSLQQDLDSLNEKKASISKDCQGLDSQLQTIRTRQICSLQQDMKNTQAAIQALMFDAVQLWQQTSYQPVIKKDYVNKVQFQGCSQTANNRIAGVFKMVEGSSIVNTKSLQQLVVESGHKVLYGQCTKIPSTIKPNDVLIIQGYANQGVIHANSITISALNNSW